MLIVEGPDGAGKTNLARRLSGELDWPIAERAVGADTMPLVDMATWLDDNLARGFHEVIYDRHRLISEPIYGPWVRRELGEGFRDYDRLRRWCGIFDALLDDGQIAVIYCLPPLNVVMANLDKDEDAQNDRLREEMPGIYWQYFFDCARRNDAWNGWVLRWDYTTDHYAELLEMVIDWSEGKVRT